ncbi:F-box family protein [Prunus dulcis]|uniref:F-box family protein n=1 Tax=Prunus dulcis TaxID=3755 RepID=A0A4Y1QNL9_PRUDU|nr:F-box family protein [Prunus dulcis]
MVEYAVILLQQTYMAVPVAMEKTNTEKEEHDNKPYILQLPDHITVHIFCKVPIKTLIQCQCVCKSWRHSLLDPHFTKDLFSRTPPSFLFHGLSGGPINPKSEGYLLVDLNKISSPNDFTLKLYKDPNVRNLRVGVLGSCNGLLCIYELNRRCFYISNPITSESLALPTLSLSPLTITSCERERIDNPYYCGFGYSPISNAYKVVLYLSSSSKSHEYEDLEKHWECFCFPSSRFQPYGVYVNGFLHWVGQHVNSSTLICAFDVESECFRQLSLPPYDLDLQLPANCLDFLDTQFTLGVLNGSLSLTVRSRSRSNITVWLMKDYGIHESWTKELEISSDILGSPSFSRAYTPGTRSVVTIEVDGIPSLVDECVHIPSFVSLRGVITEVSLPVRAPRDNRCHRRLELEGIPSLVDSWENYRLQNQ